MAKAKSEGDAIIEAMDARAEKFTEWSPSDAECLVLHEMLRVARGARARHRSAVTRAKKRAQNGGAK